MTAQRTKPVINKESASDNSPKPDNGSMGCYIVPIGSVIGYFIASAIVGVLSNSATSLDQFICIGIVIGFVIICIWGFISDMPAWEAREAEKKVWREACTVADVAIVSRHTYPYRTSEDGYGKFHSSGPSWHLDLEMNSDQIMVSPSQTIVSVNVSQHIFKRLEKSNTVRIYYILESPLTFLLEGEL